MHTTHKLKRKLRPFDAQVNRTEVPCCVSSFVAQDNREHIEERAIKRKRTFSPGKQRRWLVMRLKRPLSYCIIIPTTPRELRIPRKEFLIEDTPCTHVVDPRGGIQIAHWSQGIFSEQGLTILASAMQRLHHNLPRGHKNRCNNEPYFGLMRTMSPSPFLLRGSTDEAVTTFISSIYESILAPVRVFLPFYFSFCCFLKLNQIAALMKQWVPHMVKLLEEHSFCGIFPAFTFATKRTGERDGTLYKDVKDAKWGLCAVVYFGDFKGGELYFPDVKVRIKAKHGGLVLFNSGQLRHQVLACEGTRNCLVLFSHGSLYFPPPEK